MLKAEKDKGNGGIGSLLGWMNNMYESKIPPELEKDIYEAEARTAAAQGRNKRLALYGGLALFGLATAFFNVFLTELRTTPGADGALVDLNDTGFGWAKEIPFFSFLFLSRLGGMVCLFGGGASALLAEAEYDTRRLNAEKIFEEMKKRREQRVSKKKPSSAKKATKRKRQKKSLRALSEVVAVRDETQSSDDNEPNNQIPVETLPVAQAPSEDGLMGKVKEFYKKADTMAATQALLLNKKLEDEGVLEKITDESGLKVVGKEAAAEMKRNEKE